MTRILGVLLAALALTLIPVGLGVWLVADAPARAPQGHESTPLASYDTSTVAIARHPFCDRIVADAVTEALDAEADSDTAWTNGDPVPGSGAVAHESGCSFAAPAGAEASAWVLTPPVTPARAESLAAGVGKQRGCRVVRDAARYGAPGVATVCARGNSSVAAYHGLFGDAWLSCRLALPKHTAPEDLLDRTGRWCVAVAKAATD